MGPPAQEAEESEAEEGSTPSGSDEEYAESADEAMPVSALAGLGSPLSTWSLRTVDELCCEPLCASLAEWRAPQPAMVCWDTL